MRGPAVSVLLPVFNGAAFVAGAIESVLAQSYANFEIVVVDDGSTDETVSIVETYQRDRRVRLIRVARNAGLVSALNLGLRSCRADLVARLDADDRASRSRLEHQVPRFEDPAVVLSACGYRRVNEEGQLLREVAGPLTHGALAMAMLGGNRLCHSSVMFRRSVVMEMGGYEATWFPVEDYDLWLRLLAHGKYAGVGSVEVDYLENTSGISARRAEHQLAVHRRRRAEYVASCFDRVALTGAVTLDVELIEKCRRALSIELAGRGLPLEGLDQAAYRLAFESVSGSRVGRHLRVARSATRLWLREGPLRRGMGL